MTDALAILAAAFDRAAAVGALRDVWWRDDDATAPSDRLDALHRVAADAGAPLALAAIPAGLDPSLVVWCTARDVVLLQHGAAHRNHEPAGKPAELGPARSAEAVLAELVAARTPLELAATFVPVLVPPWNRMRDDLSALLGAAGWRGVSRFGADAAPGRVDAHLDPVAWRGDRSLLPPSELARMMERAAATRGPIGLLTHHLVHDAAIAAFVAAVARLVADHPGATWVSARDLFP